MKSVLTLALLASFGGGGLAQQPAKDRMVVVVSLDGFPAYSLDDPKLPVPTLRRLARNGVSGRMTTSNPAITWPIHTTMVSGVLASEHGLLANGTIVRTGAWPPVKIDPMLDMEKMVHAPTVYDAAHRAGLTTAQVDWVAINNAPGITWPFAEWPSTEGVVEKEMMGEGIVTAADIDSFTKSNIVYRDRIWTDAAVHLIRRHKPNLLLFHLLSLDSSHHQYGPRSLAGTVAMAFLDDCVARLVEAVRAAGMSERTTFVVVSDHGFKRYTRQIRPNAALAAAGLSKSVYALAEGGAAYVYFDKARGGDPRQAAERAFGGVEGIDRVIGPEEFPALGLPLPGQDPQAFDLLLTAKDGYAFSGAAEGPATVALPAPAGTHGYPAADPEMDAILIVSGYGAASGKNLGRVTNLQIAPTLAGLLGVALPAAKSAPLPLD